MGARHLCFDWLSCMRVQITNRVQITKIIALYAIQLFIRKIVIRVGVKHLGLKFKASLSTN